MSAKITINSDETIVCPQCSEKFPLDQGITRQTIEKYENEFEKELVKRGKEREGEIAQDAEKKASKTYSLKILELESKLDEKEASLKQTHSLLLEAGKKARAKAQEEFELERRSLQEDLSQKEDALKKLRENELSLRKERQKMEEEKQNLELENQRKLDAERRKIQEQMAKTEAEKFRFKEAEYRKKLEDAQKVNDELTRKLEQGSQQLQGEVLELELEEVLRSSFPHDKIEPVRKGARGADVLQKVFTPSAQLCGTIIWEAKRAENWSDKWIQKLKDDQLEANAELAVLVSTQLPKDVDDPFTMIGDIWVTSHQLIRPVAETLRLMLIEANKLKLASIGKSEKMELLYNYLSSPQFAQKVRSVVETFISMKADLDREKSAMLRLWKKRESQISRVVNSMSGMIGELQGIAQDSLPQLESIEQLSLPSAEDAD